jgi:hypothetical protein
MLARTSHACTLPLASAVISLSFLAGACASNPTPEPQQEAPPLSSEQRTVSGPAQAGEKPAPVPERAVEIKPTAPDQYVVIKGDTLWDIASHFLKDPWYWPEIWHVNSQVTNPHLIYPGDVLTLYYVNGRPFVQVSDGPRVGGGMTKLSPQVRVEGLDRDDDRLPIEAIQQFITRPRVVSKEELDKAPYVLSAQDDRLIYGSGDRVYVRSLEQLPEGHRYSVFRPGEVLVDPVTNELLGYEAILVADATVVKTGDPSTVLLERSEREALIGDRLLPLNDEQARAFFPRAPKHEVNGLVISLFDAISQIGQHQVVVLNVGERNGIEKGHVLAVHQAGRMVHDPYARDGQSKSVILPTEKAGVVMIFRTFEKVSYALVMNATRPMHVGDAVQPPK